MEPFDQIVRTISLTMGAAWGSGINLYATVLVLGFLGRTGNMVLPDQLAILMDPMVTAAAGIMYLAEFVADKVPGVDTGWDGIHTFIRIPAGALLAAGAVGDVNPAVAVAAGILGAGVAAGAHATKAGSRVLINTSPEPFSNWAASIMEDIAVIGGVWAALRHPWVFLVLFAGFVLTAVWLLPRLWRGIKKVFRFVGKLFNSKGSTDTAPVSPPGDDAGAGGSNSGGF
ncbi:MAG: DUF4126 domain-containing protein [Pseudomonadota bacterium]